jgi:hypothetical protein
MKSTFHFIIGIIILILVLAHLLVIGLFICPTSKLVNVVMASDVEYVNFSDVPEHVRRVFSNDQPVNLSEDDNPIRIITSKVLMVKQQKFFDEDERQELYLNTLDFGGDIIGIQSASNYYFQKPVSDLSFEESLTLAGIFRIFSNK